MPKSETTGLAKRDGTAKDKIQFPRGEESGGMD